MAFMVVLAIASVTFLSIRSEEFSFRSQLQQRAGLLLGTLAASSADALYTLDADKLINLLVVLREGQVVSSGRFYDRTGRIIADARDRAAIYALHPDPIGVRLIRSDTPMFEWRPGLLFAGQGVMVGRQRLGAVSVELSTEPLVAALAARRRQGVEVALAASLAGTLLALVISRSITGPLQRLTKSARRIAAGDLAETPTLDTGDEVGTLAEALNRMTAQLRATIDALGERAEALSRSEEGFRAVADTALDAIVSADASGSIIYVNRAACRIFGYAFEELVGQPLTVLMPDRFVDSHKRGFARFLTTSEGRVIGRTIELAGRRKDGMEFPLDISLSSWKTDRGVFFTAILRDVSERKTAEEAVRQAKDAAERANRAKSEFLSRMSHELRTPLNAILGFGQLLEMDALAPEQKDSVDLIVKAGRHLLELINEVLDISRIESGRLALSPEVVALDELATEGLDLISPLAAEREVILRNEIPGSGLCVLGDRQRLKQVLLNLLSNAVKYNRVGGTVTLAAAAEGEGRVQIIVADTGRGIPPNRLDRLFVPFDRLGAEQGDVEGTGLGLALSKTLVELMGGTIGVESDAGRGTTVRISMPRSPEPETTSPAQEGPRLHEAKTV